MRETREGRTRHSGEREIEGDGTTWELRLKRGRERDLISLVSSREGGREGGREWKRGEGVHSIYVRNHCRMCIVKQRRRTDQISRH